LGQKKKKKRTTGTLHDRSGKREWDLPVQFEGEGATILSKKKRKSHAIQNPEKGKAQQAAPEKVFSRGRTKGKREKGHIGILRKKKGRAHGEKKRGRSKRKRPGGEKEEESWAKRDHW